MPELPEVERVRRALQPVMEGARFVEVVARRPDLRRALPRRFAARLTGQIVGRLDRRGKYLVAELASGDVLLMHLGMSGSFRIDGTGAAVPLVTYYKRNAALAHDHIVFRMSSGAVVTFNDPRRFGSMDLVDAGALAAHRAVGTLGPEPLDASFTAAHLARACHRRKVTVKAALMDQRVVAGLGNIYVCDALHVARLSPKRRASTIATHSGAPRDAAARLTRAVKSIVQRAVDRGQSAAVSESQDGDDRFRVYGREGRACPRRGCRGTIRRIVQSGRSTFFCPLC
ncbi:MAG TPA: bifunctional DNA-formamidopyrimidine glycosylase/DNA-(apurinic or apyrimidinic site) lyase, partial [Vicinamibacterales bacterium]|nr:bifunctional DNA-formamidopyrimidine glycosylase/DNA-(apurinic or apyrimidinic site) lyase [Vicinamibacterales bacterium]